jgi:DNA-binding Lrp family transcriptional regulator
MATTEQSCRSAILGVREVRPAESSNPSMGAKHLLGRSNTVHQPVTKPPGAKRLDEIDLRILTELQRDGRITFQRLSELVGLSPRPCLERVRRLERAHIVVGYTTRVDLRRLVNVVAIIAQVVVKQGRGIRAHFEQYVRGCPAVVECFEVSGTFDYIIKVVCSDLEAYQHLTESWINDPALHVERIEGNVVLRAAKDGGVYPVSIATASGAHAGGS